MNNDTIIDIGALVKDLDDDAAVTTAVSELEGLYRLAHAVCALGQDVLEIGSYNGRSACVLAKAAQENGRELYSVDLVHGPRFKKNTEKYVNTIKCFSSSSESVIKSGALSNKSFGLIL